MRITDPYTYLLLLCICEVCESIAMPSGHRSRFDILSANEDGRTTANETVAVVQVNFFTLQSLSRKRRLFSGRTRSQTTALLWIWYLLYHYDER